LVRERSPELMALLNDHYTEWMDDPSGVWYHKS
jgi:hypothetical protein